MKIKKAVKYLRIFKLPIRFAGAFALFTLVACSPDMTPADYTKLPEFGSATVSLYVEKCGECHAAPNPTVHTKSMWPGIINRMQLRMTSKKVVPLNNVQLKQIQQYLVKYAQQ